MQLDLSHDKEKAVSVDTLHDLLEKARIQLDDARKTETAGLHNFQMLKQSLVDEIKYCSKGMAENGEKKAAAEGDLDVTLKELSSDVTTLEGLSLLPKLSSRK